MNRKCGWTSECVDYVCICIVKKMYEINLTVVVLPTNVLSFISEPLEQ